MSVPLSIQQLFTPATQPQWITTLYSNADTLGLASTSWQAGASERTILAIMSFALQFEDSTISLIAQGGFLDFAASGSSTYTLPDGTTTTVLVSPDPSIPTQNPTGVPVWIDVLADSTYDVQRILATYAGGNEAIINTSASTYGPFAATLYHVSDPNNKATYSNTASLTIAPSTVVGTTINAIASSGAGNLIKVTTSATHGRSTGDIVGIAGLVSSTITELLLPSAWIIDVVDTTKFTLRGSTFDGAYGSGGKAYLPTIAPFQADAIGSASTSVDANGAASAHTITQTVTTLVGVSCDNTAAFTGSDTESNQALAARCRLKLQSLSPNGPGGAYKFFALSSQVLAPLLNPPKTVTQVITRAAVFADKATGTTTTWIANASGAPIPADKTATDDVIQAYAVPLAVTAITDAASNVSVTAVANVWVPSALNNAATKLLFQVALIAYFANLDIGGATDPGGAYTHVVPFDSVLGSIYAAGAIAQIPIAQATLTLNGGTSNISLAFSASSAEVAVLAVSPPSVTLHSV